MCNGEALAHDLARIAQQKAVRARRRRLARTPSVRIARTGMSPRQEQGNRAEEHACRHLQAAGAIVLARNLRCKCGEIDLVVLDQDTLVFVEVRYRGGKRYGGAPASVNRPKQRRLILAARYFLPALVQRHFGGRAPPCRFDVVAQTAGAMVWLKQAFAEDPD